MLMFEFWIQTSWNVAFAMSLVTNLAVYFVASYLISTITRKITKNNGLGEYIDKRPFKNGQQKSEIKNGITACVMFSVVSLLARELFVGVIPVSITQLFIEVLAFA
jgi:hypothetical protein